MRQPILFALSLLLSFCLQAQKAREYTFTHYTSASGLVSNQINSIVQDDAGYLWIATNDGLQRFDGFRYKTFRHLPGDSGTISSNTVLQLLLDKKKNLWLVMTNGDAGIFDTKSFTFHQSTVRVEKEVSRIATIKNLVTDEEGNIFILYAGSELVKLNERTNTFSAAENFFTPLPEWHITSFAQQPGTRKYWIGLEKGGIALYDGDKNTLSYDGNNAGNEIDVLWLADMITPGDFLFDKKGRVWFDCWDGKVPYVYCYDLKTHEFILEKYLFTFLKIFHESRGFFEQQDGTVWVKGSQVFARYLEQEKVFEPVYNGYVNERGISFRLINAIGEDREQNIWVCTGNNGLYRFNPDQEFFSNISHIDHKTGNTGEGSPIAVIEEKDGTILTGMWGDGLYRYDKYLNEIPLSIKGIPDNNFHPVWDFYASRDSNSIWMAAQPGIFLYDQRKRSAVFYNPPVFQNEIVREIAEDKNGNVWIGMQTMGLFKWNAEKGKTKFEQGLSHVDAIPNARINELYIDSKGLVWIGTSNEGAFIIDPATDQVLRHFDTDEKKENHLPERSVLAFLEYSDSLMVIGTTSQILIYNRYAATSRTLGNAETTSGTIAAIQKDAKGSLWIATTSSLYKVNINTRAFVRFNRDDGIANDFFILSSSCVLRDGRMIFGSSSQLTVFDPQTININTDFPEVTITDVKVMNQSLRVDSLMQLPRLELDYTENSLVIEFASLKYINTFLFQYKLEGLDNSWKTADKNNNAIYSYLPPGEYTMQFKIINADGHVKDSATKLFIQINSPAWRTWWFYSLIALGGAIVLYWFDRERMRRKQAIQSMRSSIGGSLQEQLSTDLGTINVLSEMARMKADKEPDKSKEFIEQIRDKSGSLIEAVDDVFWSISPENDSMKKAVSRVLEYIDGLNNRYNTVIELLIDERTKSLNLDMKLRYESFQLFKESIEGLLKAGARNCTIHIGPDKDQLLYTIQFNNESCDMQQITNLLHSQRIAKRLKTIKASISTDIKKTTSALLLKIPVDKYA